MPSQEDINHQQRLLATYRRNLNILLAQAAHHGGELASPVHVVNGIQEARDNIRRIKQNLRGWKITVDDLPDEMPPDNASVEQMPEASDRSSVPPQVGQPSDTRPATPAQNKPSQPKGMAPAATLKGQVDFGIISIREDEYSAVLRRFPQQRFATGERVYGIHEAQYNNQAYRIATLRTARQGQTEAQDATRDMIEDLDPKLLVVVGIAGGVASHEFTLGDVVIAMSLTDFSVQAAIEGGQTQYGATGAGMHKQLQSYLAQLPALIPTLKGWNSKRAIDFPRPPVDLADDKFYGEPAWQARVKESLQHHFGAASKSRNPTAVTGSIATSNQLVKDSQLLADWQQFARQTQAVEMELGGVYQAARRGSREYPVLAIRGISDIVGFRRDDRWTAYACHTAAAFTLALLRSGFLDGVIGR